MQGVLDFDNDQELSLDLVAQELNDVTGVLFRFYAVICVDSLCYSALVWQLDLDILEHRVFDSDGACCGQLLTDPHVLLNPDHSRVYQFCGDATLTICPELPHVEL